MDLNEAAVFVKVVQAGGFSAAARQLGLPTSTVSTRVARLEKRLGVTLLQRTTRRLHLTEVGALFFQHAEAGLGHLLDAEAAVAASSGEPVGTLRVSAPADLGDEILAGLINRLRRTYPKIALELVLTDRTVDLVAEGVDAAIRAGALQDSTLIAKQVGVTCWAPLASPGYLSTAPQLANPQQLDKHACLQFAPLGKEQWTLSNATGSVSLPMAGRIIVNDIRVIRRLALSGEGIALLPTFLCRGDCQAGRLVRVLREWQARADPLYLVYPRQRFVPPKLRAFIDLASEELRGWFE
jgi:DNA-binding transcriptional LysR family regulator